MNLYVHGEGGHPAWYLHGDARRARPAGRTGWTTAQVVATTVTVLRRVGIRFTLVPGKPPADPCACRACVFLTRAASDAFRAARQPHEDWRTWLAGTPEGH